MYIDKLGNIIKYSDTYKTIKSKPVDVKPSIYIDFDKRNNEEDPKFKVGDNIRTSKLQKKKNQKEFRVEKVIKRKGDKLYVKWKDYNSSFNSWIDKKYYIK